MIVAAWLLGAVLPAVSVVSAAPPDSGCPSARQVGDALSAKLGDTPTDPSPAATLRLVLTAAPPQIDLVDDAGVVLLRRTFRAGDPAEPGDCTALAETVALIVDRYVHDVDSQARAAPVPSIVAPPVPAAPPASATRQTDVAIMAGASWRGDADPLQGFEALIGVDLQRAARERGAGVSLTVGIAPAVDGAVPGGRATLRRIPLRLGTYVSLLAGPGRLEPGLNLGIDTLFVELIQGPGSPRVIRNVSPNVEAAMAYRVRGGIYFARGALAAGLAVPYRLVGADPGKDAVLSTPRTYIRIGIETGFYFR